MTDTTSPTFAGRRDVDDDVAPAAAAPATSAPTPPPARRIDPDVEPVAGVSALEAIAAEVAAELEEELEEKVETWPVPGRPGYAVRYLCAVEYDELTAWERKATHTVGRGAARRQEVHQLTLARVVLANRCQAIIRNGEEIVDEAGDPITFASPAFQAIVGAARAVEAVQKLYGRDTDIIAASADLLITAGAHDDDGDEFDEVAAPTPT